MSHSVMVEDPPEPRQVAAPVDAAPPRARRHVADLAVIGGYVLLALFVYGPLWLDLDHGYLQKSASDQNMWEWFFAVTAHSVLGGENPLWSDLQNYPLGVNLMGNTAMLGISVPLAPLTLMFGPTLTWAIALTMGLAATAAGWYWVFSRYIARSRAGAAIGGALCGFAPPMISHGTAHPNFVGLFVLPFIVLMLLRLTSSARPVRDGVLLGLLVTWQVFLGEEPLLITATALLVFALVYAVSRPKLVRPMLRPLGIGIGVGASVTLALVALPLWWQFFGRQSYRSLEHGSVGNDLAAFPAFSSGSLGGTGSVGSLALNPTEENAFFGWPLLLLILVVGLLLWRNVAARAAMVTAVMMAWLSLGSSLKVGGVDTGVPGPWAALAELPLYESLLESRLSMACVAPMAVLLALGTDRILDLRLPARRVIVTSWFVIVAAALLPIAPIQMLVVSRPDVPAFFAEDTWRSYVDPGGTVVMAPLPDPGDVHALHWQVASGMEFKLAEGYFVGPNGPERRGTYGAIRRPTSSLLDQVSESGVKPAWIGPVQRSAAADDLRYWHADAVVLGPHRNGEVLRETVSELLGAPGKQVGGVWVWDVRSSTR